MNPFEYEELAVERLNDLRREAEARRLAAGAPRPILDAVRWWARRAWLLAGLAARRPPRRHVQPGVKMSPEAAAWKLRSPNR